MASAEDPAAAASNIFDEDLLDDDDDDESEDEDSFSIAADRNPPPSQVTVAVTGVPDLHLNQPQPLQQHHQQEIIVAAAKKPSAQPDESRKLFQRLWTDEDEIELLQGFLDYTTIRGGPHTSSHHHHHDTTAFYDQIKSKFQLDYNKNQLVEKLRRLKKKYRNVISKFGSGKDYAFKSHHDQVTFEISSKIWGNAGVANGGAAYAYRATPGPIMDEDEDDPNFPDFQSPNPNGIDVNSKTPRSRKRNRAGAVKLEQQQTINSHTNNQPLTPMAAPPPMAGLGIPGSSMSSVIEETVKSCMSPIFKELLANSATSFNQNSNPNPFGGNNNNNNNGFTMAFSPMPLGFAGVTVTGMDKMGLDDKWRKQQILELEVFSKRLKLVQDQIDEQLQELRSNGNN